MKPATRLMLSLLIVVAFARPLPARQAASRAEAGSDGRTPADEVVVTGRKGQAWSRWVRGDTADFTVYGTREDEVRDVARKMERFRDLLLAITQVKGSQEAEPLPVYLVVGADQLNRLRRQPLAAGTFATGYYSAAPTGALLAADMRWDALKDVVPRYHEAWLFAEYARHFLVQNAHGALLPAWYVDGLGLYFSTTHLDAGTAEYGKAHPQLVGLLDHTRWEPIRRIVSGELTSGRLYSAEALLLTHYIVADPDRVRAFTRFLADARRATDPVAAFEAAFGLKTKALQERLWRYRYEAHYVRLTGLPPSGTDPVLTHLPKSADALLLDAAAMSIGIAEPDRRQVVLRRAEASAAARPDDFSRKVVARAEILYGTPGRAAAFLDGLLASDPSDPEVPYLLGSMHLALARNGDRAAVAELPRARAWFSRALDMDPNHYPSIYAWAETLSLGAGANPGAASGLLLKARAMAPQASQTTVVAATTLMAQDRFDEAEALLSSVPATPRDPAAEQVPALMDQARAHRRPAAGQIERAYRGEYNWRDLNCC